jgi:hypothetical protein
MNCGRDGDWLYRHTHDVIPAQAGIQFHPTRLAEENWIPACAGMTWRILSR